MGTSIEVERQMKDELFNKLVPLFQGPPELFKKACMQILKINEEDPEDWLPDSWLVEEQQLFVPNQMMQMMGQMPSQTPTMQNQMGTQPLGGAQTIVPGSQAPNLVPSLPKISGF